MQRDFDRNFPTLDIQILGINEYGRDPGNSNELFSDGRITPWLQDLDADNDQISDVWYEEWEVTYRDVIVLDQDNEVVEVFNVTDYNLDNEANYDELRQVFIDNAVTPPETPWQNPVEPLDVDVDQVISPFDAIIVINRLGMYPDGLPPPGDGLELPPYLDVVGNGAVGPLDALTVINHLTDVSTSGSAALSDSGGTSIPGFAQPLGFAVTVNPGDTQVAATGDSSAPHERGLEPEAATDAVFAEFEGRLAGSAATGRELFVASAAGQLDAADMGSLRQLESPLLVTGDPS